MSKFSPSKSSRIDEFYKLRDTAFVHNSGHVAYGNSSRSSSPNKKKPNSSFSKYQLDNILDTNVNVTPDKLEQDSIHSKVDNLKVTIGMVSNITINLMKELFEHFEQRITEKVDTQLNTLHKTIEQLHTLKLQQSDDISKYTSSQLDQNFHNISEKLEEKFLKLSILVDNKIDNIQVNNTMEVPNNSNISKSNANQQIQDDDFNEEKEYSSLNTFNNKDQRDNNGLNLDQLQYTSNQLDARIDQLYCSVDDLSNTFGSKVEKANEESFKKLEKLMLSVNKGLTDLNSNVNKTQADTVQSLQQTNSSIAENHNELLISQKKTLDSMNTYNKSIMSKMNEMNLKLSRNTARKSDFTSSLKDSSEYKSLQNSNTFDK